MILNKIQKAQFIKMNIIEEQVNFLKLLQKDEHFIVWISNVFYNTNLYHVIGESKAEMHFLDFIKSIKKKVETKAFREKNTNQIIFGSNILNPIGFLTDGVKSNISQRPEDWIEII
jgi:hypothetical protein